MMGGEKEHKENGIHATLTEGHDYSKKNPHRYEGKEGLYEARGCLLLFV